MNTGNRSTEEPMKHTFLVVNNDELSWQLQNYFPDHVFRNLSTKEFLSMEVQDKESTILFDIGKDISCLDDIIEVLGEAESWIRAVVHQNAILFIGEKYLELDVSGPFPGIYTTVLFPVSKPGNSKLIRKCLEEAAINTFTAPTIHPQLKEYLDHLERPLPLMIGSLLKSKFLKVEIQALKEKDMITSGFIDMFSHDIGLPLTNLRSRIENLLEGDHGNLSDEQMTIILGLQRNVEKINDLRKEALMLNKLDSGTFSINRSLTSIYGLLEEVMYQIIPFSEMKNQTIELNSPHFSANIDQMKIKHVVENLVSNAVKYTPPNGRIEIAAGKGKDHFWIKVKDDGNGIPEGMEEKVFERFVRLDKNMGEGTGLGLSIVRMIVQKHGGRVWYERPSEGGSIFVVELPKK